MRVVDRRGGDDRRRTQHRERTRAHRLPSEDTHGEHRRRAHTRTSGSGRATVRFAKTRLRFRWDCGEPYSQFPESSIPTNEFGSSGGPGVAEAAPEPGVRHTHRVTAWHFRCLRRKARWCGDEFRAVTSNPRRRSEPRTRYRRNRECSPIRMAECPSAPRRLDLRGAPAEEFPHLRNRGMCANQVGDGIDALVQAGGRESGDGVVIIGKQ